MVVIGGGPAGATAARRPGAAGRSVLLLDRAGRIKPCGGAIPPRLIEDFAIPDALLVARATVRADGVADRRARSTCRSTTASSAWSTASVRRMAARARRGGRARRAASAASSASPRGDDGAASSTTVAARARAGGERRRSRLRARPRRDRRRRRALAGRAGRQCRAPTTCATSSPTTRSCARRPQAGRTTTARAATSTTGARCRPTSMAGSFRTARRCSIGTGSARQGLLAARRGRRAARAARALRGARRCAAKARRIPMKPLPRWDNGRDVVLAGDAAGVVAPASGEGIYYAMAGGRLAAEAVERFLATGDARALRSARKRFMKAHGRVFWVLGIMQRFWYSATGGASASSASAGTATCSSSPSTSYMNKELGAQEADGARAHLLQGPGASARRGARMTPAAPAARMRAVAPVLAAAGAALSVAVLGALVDRPRSLVRRLVKPGVEAAGLALRPGLDHDLRARGRAGVMAGAAHRSARRANACSCCSR